MKSMKFFRLYYPYFFIIFICVVLFHKTIFRGLIPFPGDLLVAEYQPWSSYSFDGFVPGTVPNKAQYFDTIRQMYPWHVFSSNSLRSFSIPLWNPYNFSGAPLMANFQSQIFYPTKILSFITDPYWSWTIAVIIQPFLTMIFTYLYLYTVTKSKAGSVFGAVSYGISLYMTVFLEYNIMGHILYLLPLTLLAIEKYYFTNKFKFLLLFYLSSILIVFAGHLQLSSASLGFIIIYTITRNILFTNLGQKNTRFLFLVWFLALIATSLQIIPGLELILNSARINQPIDFLINKLLIQPKELLVFLSPDIFGNPVTRNYLLDISYPTKSLFIGSGPIILAVAAMISLQKNRLVKLFTPLAIGVSILISLNPVSYLLYKLNLPLIGTSSPSNIIFLLSFCLSILGAVSYENLDKINKKTLLIIILVFLLILGAANFLPITGIEINRKNLLLSSGFLILSSITILSLIKFKNFRNVLSFFAISILSAELGYLFIKFNPFVPPGYVFPDNNLISWLKNNSGINRFWGYGSASISSNIATVFNLYQSDGYDPLYPKKYSQLLRLSSDESKEINYNLKHRSDALVEPGFGKGEFVNNPNRLKILSLLGVKYIIDAPQSGNDQTTFPTDLFKMKDKIDGFTVYEFLAVTPRIFMTDKVTSYQNPDEFIKIFLNDNYDFKSSTLVKNGIPIDSKDGSFSYKTDLVMYAPKLVEINTTSNKNAALTLSDSYYPGWKAYIDGQNEPIYESYLSLRTVYIPAGNHNLVFKYEPVSYKTGLYISVFGIILFIALYKYHRRHYA